MSNSNSEQKLKDAIYNSWLQTFKSAKGPYSVRQIFNDWGFTGMLSGLDQFFTEREFIEILQDIFDE